MVPWWNHARPRWSQTATGRRRRRSFEEAPCLWERNSPQVHIIPLPHNPFPDFCHFFFSLTEKTRVCLNPPECVIICMQGHFFRASYSCILMKHIPPPPSANVLLNQQFGSLHPPSSATQMDLNGHIVSPIRGL